MARSDRYGWEADSGLLDEQELPQPEFSAGKHEAIIKAARETGEVGADARWIERADTGKVTDEAISKHGYPEIDRDKYYYRRSDSAPGTFEVVTKPTAPAGTTPKRIDFAGGKPTRVDGTTRKVGAILDEAWDEADGSTTCSTARA